jgi:protein TonB
MIKSNNFFNELNLTHAIILSLIIHALFVMKLEISNSNLTPKPVVDIIFNTEIVKQVAPKVIPIVKPKPIIKPKPIPKPKPIIKPKPIPKPIPQPIVEPISEPIEEPITEPIVEPISESVEVSESAQINEQIPTSPNPQVVSNYSNLLRAHIAKHKKYPRIAQRRKMQGEVVIEIQIKGDGSLISKNIQKSSGHKVLDKEGMNMMEKSKPFPVPPEAMKDSVTTVLVPIAFNLI